MSDSTPPITPPEPRSVECLWCYLNRFIGTHGCDELRLTRGWAKHRKRPVGPLLAWAKRSHGYCDCEVLMNSFTLAWTMPDDLMCAVARGEALDLDRADRCPDCFDDDD
ncbi:MAG: uncharacterized protein JWL64_986 [Frankiales bacterium]|nr:uncharacterized protein [Frankiales bacterium]